MTNYLRPDEQATNSEIDSSRRRDDRLKGGLKTAAKTAIGIGAPAFAAYKGLGSKILPFLNEYIPVDLAMKGISKLSPELGNFLKRGMKDGLNVKDGLNYIKENLSQSNEPAKDKRNIIEQEAPELHQFVMDQIKQGR